MTTFNGTSGDDILNGTTGDDTLTGFEGNDTLNGGSSTGTDTAVYADTTTGYRFGRDNTGKVYVTDINTGNGNEGVDNLSSIDRLQFSDRTWGVSGGETQVNTYTNYAQYWHSVTALSNGGYVVAWTSDNQDGSGRGCFGQRYDASGVRDGAEFMISVASAGGQYWPRAAELANGNLIFVWDTDGNVFGRIFNPSGTALTGDVLLENRGGQADVCSVAALAGGGFAVSWQDWAIDGNGVGAAVKVFDNSANAVSGLMLANTYTFGHQAHASVTGLQNGSFLVTWVSQYGDGSGDGSYARLYAANGAPLTGEFLLNTTTVGHQGSPSSLGLADGSFVSVWGSYGTGLGVRGQRFTSAGVRIGGEFQINTAACTVNEVPSLASLADGGFVVTWDSADADVSGIHGQRFTAQAVAVGGEFQINTTTTGVQDDQWYRAVAGLKDGGFVATWISEGQDGSGGGVYSQRYDSQGNKVVNGVYGSALDDNMDFSNATAAVQLYAGQGNDTLQGGSGSDVLGGGQGNDTYILNAAGDSVIELAGEGTDTVQASVTSTLSANVENLILTGSAAIDGYGNAGVNTLTGNSGNNTLFYYQGADTVYGGGGNDYIDDEGGGQSYAYDNMLYGEAGQDNMYGGAGNDTMDGGDDADTLNGENDNDVLIGGAGNDAIYGGGGTDTASYSGSWINSTVSGTATNATVTGPEGTDTLFDVENVRFNGVTVATASAVNDAPIGVSDANGGDAVVEASPSVAGDANASGNVLTNDTDADLALGLGETLAVSAITGGTLGVAKAGTYGSLVLNSNGSYTYTLDNNDSDTEALTTGQSVTDSFSYTVVDAHGLSGTATINILIQGSTDNTAPVSVNGSSSGTENAAITGNASATDADSGDTLTYSVVGTVPDGLTFNTDGSYSFAPSVADQALDTGESRVVSFDFKANDGLVDSNTSTITLTINGVNDAPVASNASTSGTEDGGAITGSVSATDADVEALTYSLVDAAPDGVVFNSDGTFSVTPLAGDQGLDTGESRIVSFDYVANDGTEDSVAATVTVTINGVNDAPVAANASASGTEDNGAITGSVSATDADVEALTFSLVDAAPDGVVFNSDGTFSVTPLAGDQALDAGESRIVSFDYVANDGSEDSVAATVTVTITGANDAPVASNASASGTEDGGAITGSVSATDADVEALTYSLVDAAPDGVVFNSDGTFSVTPLAGDQALDAGESRIVSFDYVANDGSEDSVAATVTVTINGVNDAPELSHPSSIHYTDTVFNDSFAQSTGTLTASDADIEDLSFGLTGSTDLGGGLFSLEGQYGTLTLNSTTGEYTFVANDTAIESLSNGETETFTVTVSDGTDTDIESLVIEIAQNGVTESDADDNLSGTAGADSFAGLDGDDTYTVDALDTVLEGSKSGNDTIITGVNYTLGDNLENLILTGRATSGTGNAMDNVLTGNNGNNQLMGGEGEDVLIGGLGTDTLLGGQSNDTYVVDSLDKITELAGEGVDTVESNVSWILGANLENLQLTGTGAISGTGNVLNNVLTGNNGFNTLTGGAGNDTLDGGLGIDTLNGGDGNDVLLGGLGNDLVNGGLGSDTYQILRGQGTDTITDAEASANTDVLWFNDATISSDQLWFRQSGADLEVAVIGTTTKALVKNWFSGAANQIEEIRAGDGLVLLNSEVQNLVSAMAAFSTRPAGSTSLTVPEQAALTGVLAANWS